LSDSDRPDDGQPQNSPHIRLSKLMADLGLCSRREADRFIEKGWVRVNGVVINQLGTKVDPSSKVEILAAARKQLQSQVTILLNKPKGYVSSQPEDGYRAAVELIKTSTQDPSDKRRFTSRDLRGLAPAGRLDFDSQGLLVLTQDGAVARTLIGPDSRIEKEYLVRVGGQLSPDDLARLNQGGMVIEGRKLLPARVEWVNDDQLRFVLVEGMKRQIRKMCEAVGLKVLGLKRVRIGSVMLGSLPEGRWRYLREGESFD